MDALLLGAGFLILLVGAELLIKGSSSVATRLGISPLVIGLTVVSFGTSLPEMLVSVVAGLRGSSDLAIANVIGSNIANILLVLGIAAMVRPLPVRESTVVSEIPFSLTAALLVGFLANAALFSSHHNLSISRLDGAILLFFFFLFLLYVYKVAREKQHLDQDANPTINSVLAILYISLGIVGLYLGGQWVVDGAISITRSWGVGDALIGLTVVAIGTSSPEIVASALAAYRKHPDMAVGNVVGSSIFNLLWVLGITASIVELPFKVINNTDLVMVIVSSALIILALVTSRSSTLLRSHGLLFVALYGVYLSYVVYRG
ncbi:MAG: calcium/sodium antiporter [Gammaproteobacteria bacterium]|nr:calcium/sodium antiporter [Gammaproteobacteria bacterium]